MGIAVGFLPSELYAGGQCEKLVVVNGGVKATQAGATLQFAGSGVRNIAGYRLGRNYMGTFGYPQSFVIAEDDALNPWPPYRVEHGFDRGESTVTACGTSSRCATATSRRPAEFSTPNFPRCRTNWSP